MKWWQLSHKTKFSNVTLDITSIFCSSSNSSGTIYINLLVSGSLSLSCFGIFHDFLPHRGQELSAGESGWFRFVLRHSLHECSQMSWTGSLITSLNPGHVGGFSLTGLKGGQQITQDFNSVSVCSWPEVIWVVKKMNENHTNNKTTPARRQFKMVARILWLCLLVRVFGFCDCIELFC